MLKKIQFVARYVKYRLSAKGRSSIASEFVREIFDEVLHSNQQYYAFEEIEGIRSALKNNHTTIQITDFGAGSNINNSNERKISDIAKNSAKSPKLGQMMFRLIEKLQPQTLLELGTSLGISACYQIGPNKNARLVTMEGCPATAKIAEKVLSTFKAEQVEIKVGDFAHTLPEVLATIQQLDYAFFDGNHQKQPTLDYFEKCLPLAHENTVFIFDDIHWSPGMEESWEIIKNHPSVTLSIDLFWVGLVFFRKEPKKEHYILAGS